MEDLEKRIKEANDMYISEEEDTEQLPSPIDILQAQRNIKRDYSRKQYPRGARTQVLATVQDVINGAGTSSLCRAYERAKAENEALRQMGDYRRAQLVINQYMEEKFLPAVEVVINFTSPDELLNSKEALKELDKYALGVGSMSGYTAAYVREAYGDQLGQAESASSPAITNGVIRLNGLLDTDQMQTAYAVAKKLKKMVDDGEAIASEPDYELILTVASHA